MICARREKVGCARRRIEHTLSIRLWLRGEIELGAVYEQRHHPLLPLLFEAVVQGSVAAAFGRIAQLQVATAKSRASPKHDACARKWKYCE